MYVYRTKSVSDTAPFCHWTPWPSSSSSSSPPLDDITTDGSVSVISRIIINIILYCYCYCNVAVRGTTTTDRRVAVSSSVVPGRLVYVRVRKAHYACSSRRTRRRPRRVRCVRPSEQTTARRRRVVLLVVGRACVCFVNVIFQNFKKYIVIVVIVVTVYRLRDETGARAYYNMRRYNNNIHNVTLPSSTGRARLSIRRRACFTRVFIYYNNTLMSHYILLLKGATAAAAAAAGIVVELRILCYFLILPRPTAPTAQFPGEISATATALL